MTRRGTHHLLDDDPRHQAEVEAAAMSTAIAGLRRRLRRHGIEHPSVRRELGKLEELLTTLFEQAGRPGRHRRQASRPVGRQAVHEADLKPDPAKANTAAEYVVVLGQYRAWSGDPSWRQMAAASKQRATHSTIYKAMHRQELPKLEVVEAIVIGCGGQEDLPAFVSAWHRINSAGLTTPPDPPCPLPAPVQVLHLVPGN
jgi:hypothetical protein